MSPPLLWIAALCALLPPLGVAVAAALRGGLAQRFAASQLATTVAIFSLVLTTFAIDQPSSIDLAITLALLGLPGSLLVAVFVERWL
ncbi:hypothetical protein [Methylobacterium haplocladii]|uniref:Multicomponent Na+:H+ antiporter subunit F n=1 Tax=Methylobacterium haplocladii TaxID=1176176 RepID=A0A512IT18_9HYPH|nr:hypothetical protein [Methylobacterium haplocladii]GEP00854.1 hypothetical protein MHA02_32410 [Methylobacterium haplocladii]GJD86166.1 hypothetical protein HPGCJGGD_4063 [Methylobacterium haplocladii]GLS60210.1 hypothetical protein GCM10007887_28880 [Methylobacterium haplocladii]